MNIKNVNDFLRKMNGEKIHCSLNSEEADMAIKILNSKFADYLINGDAMGAIAECDTLREVVFVFNALGFEVHKCY